MDLMVRCLSLCGLILLFAGCQSPKESKKGAIFFDPNWPNTDVGSKKANVTGLVIDFIAHDVDRPYAFSVYDHLLFQLEKKECAAVIAAIPQVGINREKFSFSNPLVRTGPLFVTRIADPSISFENKRIALENDSPAYLIAQKIEGATLALYTDISKAFEDLMQGRVDAILVGALMAESYLSGIYKGQLKIASSPLNDEAIRLITLKGKEESLLDPATAKEKVTALQRRWGLKLLD